MTDMINGRTPEEIKRVLAWTSFGCGGIECDDCSYRDVCSHESAGRATADALACIEHLEAKVPKWISVEERLPEYKTAVLGYGLRHRKYPDTDPFPAVHVVYSRGEDEGWFTFWNNEYVAVTHWMPLPEDP
jgi:hypothetical protein